MATLTIDNRIFDKLVKKAEERNTSVDALVQPVLEQLVQSIVLVDEKRQAFADWMELGKKHSETLPDDYAADDSRDSIYRDRGNCSRSM